MSYKKLVRDKIPEIIAKSGDKPVTRVLDKNEYKAELLRKLREEVEEFLADENFEELADIQEVVLALAELVPARSWLEAVRAQKAKERGGFAERIYLEGVE